MSEKTTTTIRIYGSLRTIRTGRGLPRSAEVHIPGEGRTARDISIELELPDEKIEGVFVNHKVYGLDRIVMPGDEIAFISTGVPGPHRYMLGIHEAGKGEGGKD